MRRRAKGHSQIIAFVSVCSLTSLECLHAVPEALSYIVLALVRMVCPMKCLQAVSRWAGEMSAQTLLHAVRRSAGVSSRVCWDEVLRID